MRRSQHVQEPLRGALISGIHQRHGRRQAELPAGVEAEEPEGVLHLG
ncbi:hypothetical protein [Sinosporangium album]|nr:hypothetical protein [Sinosporangium album]